MAIRKAGVRDLLSISRLLGQLGYPNTERFIQSRMIDVMTTSNAVIIVYEKNFQVLAFMAIDFVVHLGLETNVARISCFAIDPAFKFRGIGKEMEEYAEALAMEKNCKRIELHCTDNCRGAHRFYETLGYVESPKYFIKTIDKKRENKIKAGNKQL